MRSRSVAVSDEEPGEDPDGTAREPTHEAGDNKPFEPLPCAVCKVPLPDPQLDPGGSIYVCRAHLTGDRRTAPRTSWCGDPECAELGPDPAYCEVSACRARILCWGDAEYIHPACVPRCAEPGCGKPPCGRSRLCEEHRRIRVRALTLARVRRFRAT